jgi:hypothetical protein
MIICRLYFRLVHGFCLFSLFSLQLRRCFSCIFFLLIGRLFLGRLRLFWILIGFCRLVTLGCLFLFHCKLSRQLSLAPKFLLVQLKNFLLLFFAPLKLTLHRMAYFFPDGVGGDRAVVGRRPEELVHVLEIRHPLLQDPERTDVKTFLQLSDPVLHLQS